MTILANTIKETGNPFTKDSNDLLALDSREMAYPAVVYTVHQIEKLGKELCDAYAKEWLVSQTKPISDPIKKKTLTPVWPTSSPRKEKVTATSDFSKK